MRQRLAVLDLGTNTFHLQIAEFHNNSVITIYKEKLAVRIGKGGISEGFINEAGQNRAIDALVYFKQQMDLFKVNEIKAIATSAFRNAKNGAEVVHLIKSKTGIEIQIIDGNHEAELIYKGISLCIQDLSKSHLVVDIGGGSVEFIVGKDSKILWKKSIEIGGQRLMDMFHLVDPIPSDSISQLENFLDAQLIEIQEAINRFKPEKFIGSSGSFDTLDEIYRKKTDTSFSINDITEDYLPVSEFLKIHDYLLIKNKRQRLLIPGMIPLRADMIVVASVLIKKIVSYMNVDEIVVSTCSLKDGIIKLKLDQLQHISN